MNTFKNKHIRILTLFMAFALVMSCFIIVKPQPVYAINIADYQYITTVNAGQSYSLNGVVCAEVVISGTYGFESGHCPYCYNGGSNLNGVSGSGNTSYPITVDGATIASSNCNTVVDLSQYTNSNATISVPAAKTWSFTVSCDANGGGKRNDSCGYSYNRSVTATGYVKLYGYKSPQISSNLAY